MLTTALEPLIDRNPVLAYRDDDILFPHWLALLVAPGREVRAAEWLQRFDIHAYLPTFGKQVRRRGKQHGVRLCAVIPGMLFVPEDFLAVDRLWDILDYAHVRGVLHAGDCRARLSKSDIEVIREMEAKLNLVALNSAKPAFEIGQPIRFKNEVYSAFLGEGIVISLANGGRVGVEVRQLFGAVQTVFVPAAEIESM